MSTKAHESTDFPSYEEMIASVMSRYSVLDLTEMSDEDLERGDELLDAAEEKPEIVASGEVEYIGWWRVRSGERFYEVRRLENFVWCSCRDFFFRHKACKHVAATRLHANGGRQFTQNTLEKNNHEHTISTNRTAGTAFVTGEDQPEQHREAGHARAA